MKSKELIKELQELDPTGEIEVIGSWGDIYFAETQPAYWDGRLGVLIRDKEQQKKGYYHVKGMKFFSSGSKIVLHEMNLREVVWDSDMNDEGMQFQYDSEDTRKAMESRVKEELDNYNKQMEKRNVK